MCTRSFSGVKWPARGVDHPPQLSAEIKVRVELYRNSISGHSLPVIGWSLPLPCLYISSPPVTSQASIDLFQTLLIFSSKVFQVVFVHSFYNSALFLPSCCCSFFLHVAANFISIFLVSRQLVLLSALPKFLYSLCGQKWCTRLFLWKKFISTDVNRFLSFCLGVQI
jgi:hypothetical protein